MKFEEVKTGEIFNLGNTPSYPKLKTDKGYVDMRDEIVNDSPNPAVLSADVTLMTADDLVKQFNETKMGIEKWIGDLRQKFLV